MTGPSPHLRFGMGLSATRIGEPMRRDRLLLVSALRLELVEQSRQVNHGPAQDALNDLDGAVGKMVALRPVISSPYVELLGYRQSLPRAATAPHPGDRPASRLMFTGSLPPSETHATARPEGVDLTLLHDPDGYAVPLDRRP